MSEFTVFDEVLDRYETVCPDDKAVNKCGCKDISDIVNEGGLSICGNCGQELNHIFRHDKEWRYYGNSENKRSSDPNRVHARKVEEKNISKDVAHMNFSDSIIASANDIYSECTNGQIYRGGSRKALIFACVFHAYKLAGNHQTPDNLIQVFGLTRKSGLKGMKIVNTNISKKSDIHNSRITINHIINDIMSKFLCSDEQKMEVDNIYEQIKNKSSNLNRSRPQSVAASVIYYWIIKTKAEITISEFAKITKLSEMTIQKNVKEIVSIFDSIQKIS